MQKKVLILGTHNSIVSPMMSELIKHITFKQVDVYSAGISPKKIHPFTVKVLLEMGIDVADFKTHSVNEYVHTPFDIIITVTPESQNYVEMLISSRTKIHKVFDDPTQVEGTEIQQINAFRKLRDEMNDWLNEFLPRHRLL
ncbi:MAG: hypothetical protein D6677_11040 [Calditrichaeota bacterium]|nr:MAG: hypothetical protein D6677_11040 [Calditrichota bacterium]